MTSTDLCRLGLGLALALAAGTSLAAGRPRSNPPPPVNYDHVRYAPDHDIERVFHAFVVSFDSKDDDNGDGTSDLLRVPHWVAQEIRRWEPEEALQDDNKNWCLDTLKTRPNWFTDPELFASGVAPNDDSYKGSGFNRGHMAMKLLVERLGQDAAWNTHTVLNAIPQRPKFNQGIWQKLEFLTGAWAQKYKAVWVIQGPVFYDMTPNSWIGDEGERRVAVPDAAFKIVVRGKTTAEKQKASEARQNEEDEPEILAFLFPQLGPGYFGPTKDFRHERYLTSVEEIESLTGLEFPVVNDKILEKRIKRRRASALWEPQVVDAKEVDEDNKPAFLSGCRGR